MRKPTTGEPCAGEPHARFGGRGGQHPSRPLSVKVTHPIAMKSRSIERDIEGWRRSIVSRPSPTIQETALTQIAITRTTSPKQPPADETLAFGKVFTDHMFLMDYDEGQGWHDPRIVPYGPFTPGSGHLRAALRPGDLRRDEGVPRPGRARAAVPAAGSCAPAEPLGALSVHTGTRPGDGGGVDPRPGGGRPALGAVAAGHVAVHPPDGDRDRDVPRRASVQQLPVLRDPRAGGRLLQGGHEPGPHPGIGQACPRGAGRAGRGEDRGQLRRQPVRRRGGAARPAIPRCCGWTASSIATSTRSAP